MVCPAETEWKGVSREALGRRVCKSWGTVHIILDFEKSAGRRLPAPVSLG